MSRPLTERERLKQLAARNPFGAWLQAQRHRPDWVGRLGRYAARDRRFPRAGTPRQVHNYVRAQIFDEDTIGALGDAQCEWRTALINLERRWR